MPTVTRDRDGNPTPDGLRALAAFYSSTLPPPSDGKKRTAKPAKLDDAEVEPLEDDAGDE